MHQYKEKLNIIIKKQKRDSLMKNPHLNNSIIEKFQSLRQRHNKYSIDGEIFNKTISSNMDRSTNKFQQSYMFYSIGYLCGKKQKELVIIEENFNSLDIFSFKQKNALFSICFQDIKKIILSQKNEFLIRIHYKNNLVSNDKNENKKNLILLEIPNRKWLIYRFEFLDMKQQIMKRKSFDIEGNDDFQNCSLNLLPSSDKRGILEFFVDDLFTDWEIQFVCLSPHLLYVLPLKNFIKYESRISYSKIGRFYKLISYNVVSEIKVPGIRKKNSFMIKILNEDDEFIFNALSVKDKEDWIKVFN